MIVIRSLRKEITKSTIALWDRKSRSRSNNALNVMLSGNNTFERCPFSRRTVQSVSRHVPMLSCC